MSKFLISIPQMPLDEIKATWTKVVEASVGSGCKMDQAYINESKAQALCCWDAPDRTTIEGVFTKAEVNIESIEEVVEYTS